MKFQAALLLQFQLIFLLRSNRNVECAVGLYGPDRYEGISESCLLPMDFGHCRAKIQRYYFDIRRMKCNMFYWGGCAGNDNNFKSIEECNDFCDSHGGGYHESNSVVPTKQERVVSNQIANDNNSNANTKNTRGGGNSGSKPSATKFTGKKGLNLRDNSKTNNSYTGPVKASPKTDNFEDEEYED